MKYFVFIALVIVGFMYFAATGHAAECTGNSQENFMKTTEARGQVVYTINKNKQQAFKAQLAGLLKPDVPYTDQSSAYLSKLNPEYYGVVVFDGGCVVLGSVQVIPTAIMIFLLKQSHVETIDMQIIKASLEL